MNGNLIDDSDEFFLADTEEESDGSVDLELGQADYWKCVKCNNQQNNPMYRYCERCFQVGQKFLNDPVARRNPVNKIRDKQRNTLKRVRDRLVTSRLYYFRFIFSPFSIAAATHSNEHSKLNIFFSKVVNFYAASENSKLHNLFFCLQKS